MSRRAMVRVAAGVTTTLLASAVPAVVSPQAAHAATITVTSLADAGPGSLRDAVARARGGDTVVVPAGTLRLTREIPVPTTITIAGAARTVLHGGDRTRLLRLGSSTTITLRGLTFAHGRSRSGGGAVSASTAGLTIVDCVFADNATVGAGGDGGALHVTGGTVHISGSTFARNTAAPADRNARGGAVIAIAATVAVVNSTFSGNAALGGAALDGQGGALAAPSSVVAIGGSAFTGNLAQGGAGTPSPSSAAGRSDSAWTTSRSPGTTRAPVPVPAAGRAAPPAAAASTPSAVWSRTTAC